MAEFDKKDLAIERWHQSIIWFTGYSKNQSNQAVSKRP
jgi:hypothetical protein